MIEIKPVSQQEIVFYDEADIRSAAKRLMDRINLQPSRIQINNKTKGVQVTVSMDRNGMMVIDIVNPEDEIFRL